MTSAARPLTSQDLRNFGKPTKRSKYGNRKVEYKGMRFDSILERDRFIFLEVMQAEGRITGLERQFPFVLTAHGHTICGYIADFTYALAGHGPVAEDAKGVLTDVFRLKRKLFEAQTGRLIHIVTKKNLTSLPGPL